MSDEDELSARLADFCRALPQVETTAHFRRTNYTVGSRVFAFIKGDALVLKLPAARVTELVAEGRAERLVMGKRMMREWLTLPHAAALAAIADGALILESAVYVAGDGSVS